MPNGDFSLIQKSVHEMVYKGVCQLCAQPTNVPFQYKGRTFSKECETRASKAHVISQADGGRWQNDNILESHQYCNNLMQTVSNLDWVVKVFFNDTASIDALRAKLSEADTLYRKVLDVMDGKRTADAESVAVLKPVAHRILTDSDSNAVKRIYENRRKTILAIAS